MRFPFSTQLTAGALCLLLNSAASAAITWLDQSGFSGSETVVDYSNGALFTPVDGQIIDGVAHGFTVGGAASADATIDILLGVTDFITLESIEGDANGVLSFSFGSTQTRLGFGWALTTATGGTIELFDNLDVSLGALPFSGAPDSLYGFETGFAGIESDMPFARAEVTWNGNGRFAVDDLHFESNRVVPVFEPASLPLVLIGSLLLAAFRIESTRKVR
ncbi:MAG: hypothetical protein KDE66_11995 [Nitrosomonas sp.]|nr:hypothetical protein [Nitrosomonas sp.]MCP5250438.1 hypothetical protein [Burkholderiales bacterium]